MEQCKGEFGQHCWHPTGQMLLSNPPLIQEICCFCGKKQTQKQEIKISGRHGEFLPMDMKSFLTQAAKG